MKKMILSIAVIAGMFLMTNLNVATASEKPSISIVTEDDGFVEVRLQDLNENIQTSINALTSEYDVQTLKYNEEKKLAKVVLIKKDDQSTKKVYFNENGEKIEKDKDANQNVERESIQQIEQIQQPPFAVLDDPNQNDGFVEVKLEDLNENVQSAIREIGNTYDISTITYSSDQKITKVKSKNKADQTEKVFKFDDEGKELQHKAKDKELEKANELRREQKENIETQLPQR